MADFNKAIELDPKNAKAYFYRSDFHSDKFPQRAIADLGKTIEFAPKFVAAYIARGMKYAEMNQRARAKADFAKAIDINAGAARVIGWVHPDIVDEIEAEGRANPR